jgi:hypothetical protein
MTIAAQQVLAAFNALAPEDQQKVAVEIPRKSATSGELSDEAFDEIATDVLAAMTPRSRAVPTAN